MYLSTYPPIHCGVGEYTEMLVEHMRAVDPIIMIPKEVKGRENVVPAFVRKSDDFDEVYYRIKLLGDVDVIHVQHEYGIFGSGEGLIELIKRLKREGLVKAAVITMHSVWTEAKDTSFQRKLGMFDVVITHSYCQLYELKWQGLNNVRVIPHGTLLNPYIENYSKIRKKLGIVTEKVALIPGFVRKDKNVDKVVKAIKEVGYLPLVAGEVKDEVDLSGALVINKYLNRDELLKLYAASDVIVFFYKDHKGVYSVSGALHLALGTFKPIIGTPVPRLIELSTVPDLLVNDVNELKEKLRLLLNNEEDYIKRMRPLFQYAVETSWDVVAKVHEKLYNRLVESDRGPDL